MEQTKPSFLYEQTKPSFLYEQTKPSFLYEQTKPSFLYEQTLFTGKNQNILPPLLDLGNYHCAEPLHSSNMLLKGKVKSNH